MTANTKNHKRMMERLTKDYGLAYLRNGLHDAEAMLDDMDTGFGVPVLAMASGVEGVLRAMSVRCGSIKLDGREDGNKTLAYAKLVDGAGAVFHVWHLHCEPTARDNRPNYARDYPAIVRSGDPTN